MAADGREFSALVIAFAGGFFENPCIRIVAGVFSLCKSLFFNDLSSSKIA